MLNILSSYNHFISRISSSQFLPIDKYKAWEFFSNPKNLNLITPSDLKFKILLGAEKKIFPGQIIEYKVSPFFGIKHKWVTEITHVIDYEYFVDEQRFGPYKFWHHKHFIHETNEGVIIEDIVDYTLPFGKLGKLIDLLIIQKKLKNIFEFRSKTLDKIYNNAEFINLKKQNYESDL